MARFDMFLKARGQKSGEIVGESSDKRFAKQIEIVDWSWGMSSLRDVATGGATGRRRLEYLKLVKRVDRASTALMSVLSANDLLKEAVLSVRKAGGQDPLPYLVVTLRSARIVSYSVESERSADGAPVLTEHLALGFESIQVDYTQQNATGTGLGQSSFMDDLGPGMV